MSIPCQVPESFNTDTGKVWGQIARTDALAERISRAVFIVDEVQLANTLREILVLDWSYHNPDCPLEDYIDLYEVDWNAWAAFYREALAQTAPV